MTNMLDKLAGGDRRSIGRSEEVVASRLELAPAERAVVFDILLSYLRDESKIVKTFTLSS